MVLRIRVLGYGLTILWGLLGRMVHGEEEMEIGQDFHVDVDGISVSAGGFHVCALEYRPGIELGGPARCWGYNHHGQAEPPEGNFVQLSAGTYYTCGILLEGQEVRCWGRPMKTPPGRFLQLSVGEWHVCGLREDGAPVCWGRNDHKQSEVPEGETFVQIAAGQDITCGLRREGTIKCWGEHVHALWASQVFKQVAVGSSRRVCGLSLQGGLRCWGKTDKGKDVFIRDDGPFEQISTSPHRTCAIKSWDRSLWCVEEDAQRVVSTGGGLAWSEVSVGGEHVCGVTDDAEGALHCFAKHLTLFGDPTITSPEGFATA